MTKQKKTAPSTELPWLKHTRWLVPLLAMIVYLPSFQATFTLDDILIVEDNTYVHSTSHLGEIWTTHYWAGKIDANDTGLYRPLTLTTYNLQHALHGKSPAGYHIVNVLLHALVCFVLMRWLQTVFRESWLTAVAGILFAVHPLHTEAVSGIVGRAELLSAIFILIAMTSYHHWRKTNSWKWMIFLLLSTFAAFTSKEHGFLLPVILFLQELVYMQSWKHHTWKERSKWIAFFATGILCVIGWIVRASVTGPTAPHEIWAVTNAGDRMATAVRILGEYILMHFWPMHLSADYWTDNSPVAGWSSIWVWISFVVLTAVALGAHVWRKKLTAMAWGIIFFFLTILPVSNFFFAAGFLKAERILYIPSIGFITAMAAGWVWLYKKEKWRIPALVVILIMAGFFSVKSFLRNFDWKDNYTLALATLKETPCSPRFNNVMGLQLRARKERDAALLYFQKAVSCNPEHVPALVNLGTEYRNQGRHKEAAATLEEALRLDPGTMATYVNLMSAYRSLEDYDHNLDVAQKAVQRFPQSAAILWNAANAFHLKGQIEEAEALRAKARQIDPSIGAGK